MAYSKVWVRETPSKHAKFDRWGNRVGSHTKSPRKKRK